MPPLFNAALKKHSITLSGHRTSVTLEAVFWKSLKKIAHEKGVSLAHLVEDVDATRTTNLSSALRVYVVEYLIAHNNFLL